jgi:hypothetical protein
MTFIGTGNVTSHSGCFSSWNRVSNIHWIGKWVEYSGHGGRKDPATPGNQTSAIQTTASLAHEKILIKKLFCMKILYVFIFFYYSGHA